MEDLMCVNHPELLCATGDKYCCKCGTKLQKKQRCECGRDLYYVYAYCPRCGKLINWGKDHD